MSGHLGEPGFPHGEIPGVGVLLANLGTPDAPTAKALRRYLRQFLSDPRVIELPRWRWLPILYLFVLTTRPRKSAAKYRQIWTQEGSPLLAITRRQADGVEAILAREAGTPVRVAVGMRYGSPSIASALGELRNHGCRRILFLPLYPQYSQTTTGSSFDALAAALTRHRWVPEVRTVHCYCDEPGYIRALAASVRELWERDGRPEKLLFSFHGIPERYFLAGDPYFCHCHKTARLVARELGLEPERFEVSFQSLFGREEWVKPYTDRTVRAMAAAGIRSLDVACPGFAADCLETLEEIADENRGAFLVAGGERFRYLPCLNDRPDHVRFLADLAQRHLRGWIAGPEEWSEEEARRQAADSRRRAEAMQARPAAADGGYGS